jgi:hypothetical protein
MLTWGQISTDWFNWYMYIERKTVRHGAKETN